MKLVHDPSRFPTHPAFVLCIALGLGVATGALGQATEGEDPEGAAAGRVSEVDNITITAERRDTQLERTPVAVSAFTPDALEELNINNVVTLSEFTPNLNIHVNAGGNTGSTIGIRGAITSDPVLSLEPTVGIYMNGVYIGKSVGSLFDMPDLQGVEVLRGPQGTLWGRNTVGGAITLRTVKPSGDWALRQQFRGGSWKTFRSQTSLDVPVLGGNGLDSPSWLGVLNARLTYQYENRTGYYSNSANQFTMPNLGFPTNPLADTPIVRGSRRLDDLDRSTALVTADWALPWDIQLDYVFDRHAAREKPSAFQSTYLYPPDPTSTSCPGAGGCPGTFGLDLSPWTSNDRLSAVPNQEFQNVFLETSDLFSILDISGHAINIHREQEIGFMGDVTLRAIVGIRDMDNEDAVDYDGSPYHIQDFGLDVELETVSVELQWVGTKDWEEAGLFDYVMGFYYYQEKGSAINSLFSFGFLGGDPINELSFGAAATLSSFWLDNYSLAGFGQVTWTLPWLEERVRITGGVRYSYENREMTRDYDCIMNPPTGAPPGLCPADGLPFGDWRNTGKDDFDDWSPMANISFQATDDAMIYFRAAKGFKAGGFNGRAALEPTFLVPYKSETLWSYEGGFKTTWLNRRLLFNVAGFYSDYRNMQVTVFDPTSGGIPVTGVRNAADARIGGMELEAVAIPIEGLALRFAYALLKPEYRRFIDDGVDVSDVSNFVLAPENTITTGVGYTLPPFRFGTLSARLDVYWQDEVFFSVKNPSGQNSEDSYTTLSGRVELTEIPLGDYGTGAVALWARNLTDEEFKTFGIDWTQPVGNVSNSFGKPRTFGVDVTVNF